MGGINDRNYGWCNTSQGGQQMENLASTPVPASPSSTIMSCPFIFMYLKINTISPLKLNSSGHIPNGSVNGHTLRNGSVHNGSLSLAIHGRSVFDTEADVDIASVAAQRDQLRGTRSIRGMMAPVMSKEEESHSRSANRRMSLNKQHGESVLGDHESKDIAFSSTETKENGDKSDVLGNLVGNRSGTKINNHVHGLRIGIGEIGLRPRGDYLDATRFGDIMVQSMRRQSLRGSKQSLLDGNYGSLESNTSSRMSMGTASPDGDKYPVSEQGYAEMKRKSQLKFLPSAHEDIQILNLQGFMDASGATVDGGSTSKRKHKKKRNKRSVDSGNIDKGRETYKLNAKSRRKRNHRHLKSHLSDDDEEMMLKDIDDIDNKVAGLVLGPENVNKESSGQPITLDEASNLRHILTGSPAQPLPTEWLSQNFKQNTNPNLSYGLIQKKGGPCGVLACVQAYMMKCLIFGTTVAPNTSPISPLRPSEREWLWALGVAITEILWKAGQEQKAVLALPGSFAHFTEHGIGRYSQDGMTESLTLHEFVELQDLYDAVTRYISAFTSENSSGCVILLYSLIFTRGIQNIQTDMDEGGGHLISAHGYSSQEIVNLLLTGRAFTNTFNGDQTLGNNAGQSLVLHGITHKAEIGLLSLFEHYDCFKVGTFLKSPQYPIWVVCCESHYSCLFSRDTSVTADSPSVSKFDIYYYDGLALQEDEIRLTVVLNPYESIFIVPPPGTIRTKWKNASINWNGTDPIL
ncbi:probable ubiquitin carboxyl-terminal hydrolase MINDY-4 [Cherax quadricarinatus]